jgi:hypothetical protein
LIGEEKDKEIKLKLHVDILLKRAAKQDDLIDSLREEIEKLKTISPDKDTPRVQPNKSSDAKVVKASTNKPKPIWRAQFGLFD